MRADRLTTKFQEALGEAQTLALGNDHAYIEPAHVLAAMLAQQDGPRSLLQRAGVNVAALAQAAEAAIRKLPQVQGQEQVQVGRDTVSLLQPRLVRGAEEITDLPGAGRRVLLVEDHEVNRMLISMQLGQLGARVLSAANGRLALEILQSESVDLVLTDLQMPVMDGAELCRQLHADERWQHLPVYVITADLSEPAAQRLAECGC